jgi:cell division septal protein FtsQ
VTGVGLDREPELPRASRKWKVLALILIVALIAPASWLVRLGASKLEFFHLRSVTVEGTRFLAPESILERLALDTMRSVWDDTEPLEERLLLMSQISDVEITRKLPGTLVVTVRENLPVALVQSPRGLEPVDTAGTVLPIDPAEEDLDLPVAKQRDIGMLRLLGRIRGGDPRLYARISTISRDGRDAVVMRLDRSLRVRAPLGVSVSRLTDIFPVESDLARRRANVAELDLRYRDQVIARLQ